MKKIFTAFLIGLIAGIIDVVPMFIMHLNWYANISAFFHWIVLGLIIPFVNWNIKAAWFKGLIVAVISAFPVIIITLENGYGSVLPILTSSVILGSLIGFMGKRFIA